MEKFGFGKMFSLGPSKFFQVGFGKDFPYSVIRKILIKSEQNRYFLDVIIFKTTFLHDEKSWPDFFNFKSMIIAFQRHQLELLGVSESEDISGGKKKDFSLPKSNPLSVAPLRPSAY